MTNEDKLKKKLEELKENKLSISHIEKGPGWNALSREDRCEAILAFISGVRLNGSGH